MIFKEKVMVESIAESNIHVKTLTGKIRVIDSSKVSNSVCVGDILKHCEHGYYDVVDKIDNFKKYEEYDRPLKPKNP
jgi:hypothetical protein